MISIHAPSRERPAKVLVIVPIMPISIHAPLRERRCGLLCISYRHLISIHAPLRERLHLFYLICASLQFQSTLPYGSDLGQTIITKVRALISIHAPLRERRQCFTHFLGIFNFNPRSNDAPMRPHFNPRSLAGATDTQKMAIEQIIFQSTLPCGSD